MSDGVARLCRDLSHEGRIDAEDCLREYSDLLLRWAVRTNLVSAGDLPRLATRHILPALHLRSTVRSICHDRIADVGSGAGLPGLPLAVTMPEATFHLVESRHRRASFLRHAVRTLKMTNVQVVHERVELWRPHLPVDLVLSRAVTSLDRLQELTSRCLAPHGLLLVALPPSPGDPQAATGGALCHVRTDDRRHLLARAWLP